MRASIRIAPTEIDPLSQAIERQFRFRFNTRQEAATVAQFTAQYYPDPKAAQAMIHELVLNALEHGNFGISFAHKTELLLAGTWEQEIARRECLPENQQKFIGLIFLCYADRIHLSIRDAGTGFNPAPFLSPPELPITTPNGRGIAIACAMPATEITFVGCGNHVECVTYLDNAR